MGVDSVDSKKSVGDSGSCVNGSVWCLCHRVYAIFESHHQGVHDLNRLRAKDAVTCLFNIVILVIEVCDVYATNTESLFWLAVALNLVTVMDFGLRLLNPELSLILFMTGIVQRQVFNGPFVPFPKAALVPRLGFFLMIATLNLLLKALLPADNPAIFAGNCFMIMSLWMASTLHFCFGYVPYALAVKWGYVAFPQEMPHGHLFCATCMGPFILVDKETPLASAVSNNTPTTSSSSSSLFSSVGIASPSYIPPVNHTSSYADGNNPAGKDEMRSDGNNPTGKDEISGVETTQTNPSASTTINSAGQQTDGQFEVSKDKKEGSAVQAETVHPINSDAIVLNVAPTV